MEKDFAAEIDSKSLKDSETLKDNKTLKDSGILKDSKTLTDIKSLTIEELRRELASLGEKPFRAGQVYQWMHQKLADGFEDMSNLSKDLRQKLADHYQFVCLKPVEVLTSRLDGTQKYLFELPDGNVVESVLMRYRHGNSVCISTQVGCKMGCRFCASTIGGWLRNLTASELSLIHI